MTAPHRSSPLASLRSRRRGQTLAEYALILAFISVIAIAALAATGGQVTNTFSTVNAQLNAANNGGATRSTRGS